MRRFPRNRRNLHTEIKDLESDIGFWSWLCDESTTELIVNVRTFGFNDNRQMGIDISRGWIQNNQVNLVLDFYVTRRLHLFANQFWTKLPFNLKFKLYRDYSASLT